MSSPQHRSIAHYRITAKIGEGGMGEVYKATDTKLGREVAIKVLPSLLASDSDRMARFAREAQVLASLNHPNIASIHGVEDGALVMELIDGPTLDERIAQGPLEGAEVRQIVNQLIDALEYAHERGIVHRDLKPSNIKITPENRVKILDFGLAKALTAERHSTNPLTSPTLTLRSTTPGMILGSAAYMAPEQARGHDVDKRADIWAFGVILYEMLSRRPLFAAETLSDTIAQVLTREFDFHEIPAEYAPLLERCLVRDRRARLRDIGDARWLLERKMLPVPPASARGYSWTWLAALAGVAFLACVGGYFWGESSSRPAQQVVRFALDTATFDAKVSPDGRWILQMSNPLRIRAIDSVQWRALPFTEGARDPFWSEDSSAIGFFADGRLKAVRTDGRSPLNLAAAPSPSGGSWRGGSKDGTVLFSSEGRLHTVDVPSGTLRSLPLRGQPGEILKEPVFAPEGGGANFVYLGQSSGKTKLYRANIRSTTGEGLLDTDRAILFARHPRTKQWFMLHCDTTAGTCELMTTPIDAKTGMAQGPAQSLQLPVAFYATRSTMLLDVAQNGLMIWRPRAASVPVWRMRWFDLHGNVVGSLGEPNSYTEIALSPDETRLATSQGHPVRSLWLFDVRTGTSTRVSSLPGNERFPRWSPDGKVLYYVNRYDDGMRILAVGRRDGTQPEVIYTQKTSGLILHQVTPDGEYLLISRSSAEEKECAVYRLRVQGASGSERPECIIRSNHVVAWSGSARVTPNEKWIVYSNSAGVLADRYPRPGPAPIVIDTRTGTPYFSPDGSVLYRTDGTGLIAQNVLVSDANSFRISEPKYLFALTGNQSAGAQQVVASRDGARILVISTDQPEAVSTQVVSDWTSFLDHTQASK